ncbi:hypothetical protein EC988_000711, partial [Linderina pennispora]
MAEVQYPQSHGYEGETGAAHYNTAVDEEKYVEKAAAHFDGEEEEEDSPFEMVRIAVSNKDDTNLPCLTFRSWVLGIIFAAGLAFIN